MSRIRSLHPGLFTDDRYMALSFPARELIKGIWCEADDQGVFEWRPLTLKARIMPADSVDVGELLDELVAGKFVTRFEYNERSFGAVRNFRQFQRPKKPNSVHILPDKLRTYVGLTADAEEPEGAKPPPVPHQFPTEGGKPPQMEDGGGKGRRERTESLTPTSQTEPCAPAGAEVFDLEFQRFWQVYPRRDDRGHALKAYRTARKKAEEEAIIGGARWYADSRRGQDHKFTALAATWLNGERWLDERGTAARLQDGIIPMHPGAGG